MEKLRVGPPEDDCDITPVVSESSANFIEGLVEDARAKGAKFLTPYRRCARGAGALLELRLSCPGPEPAPNLNTTGRTPRP